MEFIEKVRIMDAARINRALARLASEIVEENHGASDLYLVGVQRRGVPLANRLADKIADLEGHRPPVGIVDITLYRDDLSTVGANPIVNRTDLPGGVDGRNIVLIDDVLYTGRTIRAALAPRRLRRERDGERVQGQLVRLFGVEPEERGSQDRAVEHQ